MPTAENETLIRSYIEAVWNEGNLDFIHAVWAADRVPECRANWASNQRFCPDGRFSIDELIVQYDKVVVRWTLEGTQPGQAKLRRNGATSDGRAITFTGITIWHIQAGRLVDSYFVSDGPGLYE